MIHNTIVEMFMHFIALTAAAGSTFPATFKDDYTSPNAMEAEDVDVAIGATTATITYTFEKDTVIEDCETFTLTLSLRGGTMTNGYAIVDPVGPTIVYIYDTTGKLQRCF